MMNDVGALLSVFVLMSTRFFRLPLHSVVRSPAPAHSCGYRVSCSDCSTLFLRDKVSEKHTQANRLLSKKRAAKCFSCQSTVALSGRGSFQFPLCIGTETNCYAGRTRAASTFHGAYDTARRVSTSSTVLLTGVLEEFHSVEI